MQTYIFLYDFINNDSCISVIDISDKIYAQHVTCSKSSQINMLDFENKNFLFVIDNKGKIYDILRKNIKDFIPSNQLKNLSDDF